MVKKHVEENNVEVQSQEGVDNPEEQSAEHEEQSATDVPKVQVAMGIGQFVRHLLKNSKKSNAEILELVLKTFAGSKTTPACIAWYKTDMRKKGLLEGTASRGKNVVVDFTQEELDEMAK